MTQWHESEKSFGQINRYPAPHALDSPDMSQYDFWFFGISKHRMMDRQLQNLKEILDAATELWDAVTFEDLQNVFLTWMERLQWAIQNGRECFEN
jgi:hypothetical protein